MTGSVISRHNLGRAQGGVASEAQQFAPVGSLNQVSFCEGENVFQSRSKMLSFAFAHTVSEKYKGL